jgi:hypothetical protein
LASRRNEEGRVLTNHRPPSELYREAAQTWVALDAAARVLENTKSAIYSQKVLNLLAEFPHYSVAKAELKVKGSDAWLVHLDAIDRARTKANEAKIEVDFRKMQSMEQNSKEAYERQELRMTR